MKQKIVLPNPYHTEGIKQFATSLNSPLPIAQALFNRGITSFDSAKNFLRPSLSNLHSPSGLLNLDQAVSCILQNIKVGQKIAIFGDYDVDGTTATALLYLGLKSLGAQIYYYVPNRFTEGYGLSVQGIKEILSCQVSLLITVDCGISDHSEIEFAKQAGLEIIILDHHQPPPNLPPADIIINPKQPGCNYSFKELSGVGLAYKLLQGLHLALGKQEDESTRFIDLVALGTAADIVPLTGENRLLVKFGMEQLAHTSHIGLQALLHTAGLIKPNRGSESKLETRDIVFRLGPLINAAGRMDNAQKVIQLLIAEEIGQAENIAKLLLLENDRRRQLDKKITEEAQRLVENEYKNDKGLVLSSALWHQGVLGIVASRMVEKYFRPTVVIAIDSENKAKGSARSIHRFHLYDALSQCQDLLTSFGGHRHAAGISLPAQNIPMFRQRFQEIARQRLIEDDLIPELNIDSELLLQEINPRFFQLINLFKPFGPENRRPLFKTDGVQTAGTIQAVGKNHLKFTVRQNGTHFPAIAFNLGSLASELEKNSQSLGLIYTIEENHWQDKTMLQLNVKGIALSQSQYTL